MHLIALLFYCVCSKQIKFQFFSDHICWKKLKENVLFSNYNQTHSSTLQINKFLPFSIPFQYLYHIETWELKFRRLSIFPCFAWETVAFSWITSGKYIWLSHIEKRLIIDVSKCLPCVYTKDIKCDTCLCCL